MRKRTWAQRLNSRLGTALLILVLLVAAGLRLYKLGSLPPALHPSEAQWARLALEIVKSHHYSILAEGSNIGYSAYIAFEAAILALSKSSVLALRSFNAILGVGMVFGIYVFSKDWFGRRAALLAAFFAAASPWAVTFSRNNWPVNLSLFALVWLLYFTGRAYRSRRISSSILAGLFLALGCYSSRYFWVVPVILTIIIAINLLQSRARAVTHQQQKPSFLHWLVMGLVAVAFIAPLVVLPLLKQSSPLHGIGNNVHTSAQLSIDNASKTGLMFFARGDEDYTRNLGGLPLLNTFTGLMFVLGILVAGSRISRAKYSILLVGTVVTLLPSILLNGSTLPDAYRAILVLPFVCILGGVGANYLLACWYGMFPINTTARTIGLSFVVLLLSLTIYQGYRQYFIAWAQDPKTYLAYREDLSEVSKFIHSHAGLDSRQNFVVAAKSELGAIAVQSGDYNAAKVGGTIETLEALPLNGKPQYVLLPYGATDTDTLQLQARIKAKLPGGKVTLQRSVFDNRVLFSWYQLP